MRRTNSVLILTLHAWGDNRLRGVTGLGYPSQAAELMNPIGKSTRSYFLSIESLIKRYRAHRNELKTQKAIDSMSLEVKNGHEIANVLYAQYAMDYEAENQRLRHLTSKQRMERLQESHGGKDQYNYLLKKGHNEIAERLQIARWEQY